VNLPIAAIASVKNITAQTANKAVVVAKILTFPVAITSFSFQTHFL
jgi:hypothetical protein